MSAKSRERKRKRQMKWVDGPNGSSTLEDRRTKVQKVKDLTKAAGRDRREQDIAIGRNLNNGCGVQAENKDQRHRSNRKKARLALRSERYDDARGRE
jgi:hypothetical protein